MRFVTTRKTPNSIVPFLSETNFISGFLNTLGRRSILCGYKLTFFQLSKFAKILDKNNTSFTEKI